MLEKNDLEMIKDIVQSVAHESENMILEELDRVQINLSKKIDIVEKNLDELNQYYRITKLENDKKSA